METLTISNLGPIQNVSVELGDLTILIGAQASGKSLLLQMFKLVKDCSAVVRSLENYGFVINGSADNILNRYLGEGLAGIWTQDTSVVFNDLAYTRKDLKCTVKSSLIEEVFYIPAQRILSIADGRPKYFMEFSENDPYVLRAFSDTLRLFVQNGLGSSGIVYPLPNRLKDTMKQMYDKTIFHGGKVVLDNRSGQRKIAMDIGNMHLPLMTWSAGQKEFMPLLMAFYCLSGPPQPVVNRKQYKYVILEEPEMGLHPLAIQTIILQIIELIHAGYKVLVSTHSSVLLEFVWAYNFLKMIPNRHRIKALKEIFGLENVRNSNLDFLCDVFEKEIRTYYFTRENDKVTSVDISTLDAASEEVAINEWGGLTQFSTKANQVVAKYMAQYGEM